MSEPFTPSPAVTITVRDNGNLKVVGPVTILDGEGNPLEVPAGSAVFLCRCGASQSKPFCDSSHRAIGFASVVRAGAASEEPAAAR